MVVIKYTSCHVYTRNGLKSGWKVGCIEFWLGALLSVGPDGVECAKALADSVCECGDGSQSLMP